MRCTPDELNTMDLGVHMNDLMEWNEQPFTWGDADVLYGHPFSTVGQRFTTDNEDGLVIAVYRTAVATGHLVSLRVFTRKEKGDHDFIQR
jgi:hypothetical protein